MISHLPFVFICFEHQLIENLLFLLPNQFGRQCFLVYVKGEEQSQYLMKPFQYSHQDCIAPAMPAFVPLIPHEMSRLRLFKNSMRLADTNSWEQCLPLQPTTLRQYQFLHSKLSRLNRGRQIAVRVWHSKPCIYADFAIQHILIHLHMSVFLYEYLYNLF